MSNLFFDTMISSDLFYQDYAGAYGYSAVAFALESLDWFRSNLDCESAMYADRIERREAEKLYRKGLLSDFQILMIRTHTPFIGMTRDFRHNNKRKALGL